MFYSLWLTVTCQTPSFTLVVLQLLSHVRLFATPWTAALQASLSIWSLLKLMSIKAVMPFNQLILCHPLLLLPSIFASIRAFSSELALRIRWPNYWSFSFSISPSNEYSGLISCRIDWFDLLAVDVISIIYNQSILSRKITLSNVSGPHLIGWRPAKQKTEISQKEFCLRTVP